MSSVWRSLSYAMLKQNCSLMLSLLFIFLSSESCPFAIVLLNFSIVLAPHSTNFSNSATLFISDGRARWARSQSILGCGDNIQQSRNGVPREMEYRPLKITITIDTQWTVYWLLSWFAVGRYSISRGTPFRDCWISQYHNIMYFKNYREA
jgi:hypothetical protein